ncbi:MAG: hypothetical protein HN904_26535, partial [Victivallales bacterium]|nr:hypothetical protein [Victivallales bacterium]
MAVKEALRAAHLDIISGLGGDDRVLAGGGDDFVFGGDGGDALFGGAGDDT